MKPNAEFKNRWWLSFKRNLAVWVGGLLLLALPSAVQAQFNYTTTNGTITITGYTGPGGAVTIPGTINGFPVRNIGDNAFASSGLTSVTIPNSVTSIGNEAFVHCQDLTSVTIPRSVTNIGYQAFWFCRSLNAITVDGLNPAYRSIGGILFDRLLTTLIQCPGGMSGSYTIPNSVTNIGYYAFSETGVTSVTVPNSVTSIGDYAFYYCSSLTSVTIGNGVTSIGNFAFQLCTSLTGVYFQGNAPSLGGSLVFYGDNNATVYYLLGTTGWGTTFGGRPTMLWNQWGQYNYTTNNGTVTITGYTGPGGPVTIPSIINGLPVKCIGTNAVAHCTNLTNVTIGNSVTSIGTSAFYGCTSLTSVMIGISVTNIGAWTFYGCTHLTNVTIPISVTGIGDDAFHGCTSLTSVMIPISVTNIGSEAFYGCTALTGIMIPISVTNIGNMAFYNCFSLTSLTIPDSVTVVGYYAFASCTSLTNVIIPNSATSIGEAEFVGCARLTSITIPNSVTNIGPRAYGGCASLTSVTIPNSVTSIGYDAFNWCTSLTSVMMGSGVANIGGEAFYSCTKLTSIYFKGNAPGDNPSLFENDNNATIYHLPGTTGWGATFGGRPTALWIEVPTMQTSPRTQTAEAGSAVGLWAHASSPLPLFYFWHLNSTNLLSSNTNRELELTNVQFSQSGAYTVVISNVLGAVTSAPAMLNVIAAVERRPVPGVKVAGETGSLLNVDCTDLLTPAPDWTTLGSVSLTSTSQLYFDLTLPLPPQRFYRAWQMGTPSVVPSLGLNFVPAITLTGNVGDTLRLDYIYAIGPTDAWVTLATVTLTNTSQVYFDVSSIGQRRRLYRIVPVP